MCLLCSGLSAAEAVCGAALPLGARPLLQSAALDEARREQTELAIKFAQWVQLAAALHGGSSVCLCIARTLTTAPLFHQPQLF